MNHSINRYYHDSRYPLSSLPSLSEHVTSIEAPGAITSIRHIKTPLRIRKTNKRFLENGTLQLVRENERLGCLPYFSPYPSADKLIRQNEEVFIARQRASIKPRARNCANVIVPRLCEWKSSECLSKGMERLIFLRGQVGPVDIGNFKVPWLVGFWDLCIL